MTVIAHLSDPHLDGSPARLARLTAVLELVAGLPAVDALLMSGDLADHGAAAEYAQLLTALPPDLPLLLVPGNHDLSDPMRTALAAHGRLPALESALDAGAARIIGLDSHIDGHDEGELGPESLAFAREQLAQATGPVLLAMHHPPVPVGHHVMDGFGLTDRDDLAILIREHPCVVAVLTGHVHTALATTFAGVPLLGAPGIVSTMRPGSRTDPIADTAATPGLALHTLEGSVFRTVFHHLSPVS